jgi:hypothetical protein
MQMLNEKQLENGDYVYDCTFEDGEFKTLLGYTIDKYLKNEADELTEEMNKLMSFAVTGILREQMERDDDDKE